VLVDELAHSNAPGSRHAKRWQDIQELLAAGIDVFTTVNVQHLESLNDQVRGITGVQVRETLPDWVLQEAYELLLIDLPPRELLERLRDGKVYVPEQARAAIDAFFTQTNLTALRELAMQTAAAQVDNDLAQGYRQLGQAAPSGARSPVGGRRWRCPGRTPGAPRQPRRPAPASAVEPGARGQRQRA
jgi:two-component system sensor histidine kinase KdpD